MALNLFNPPDVDSGECDQYERRPCQITGVMHCDCSVCEPTGDEPAAPVELRIGNLVLGFVMAVGQ